MKMASAPRVLIVDDEERFRVTLRKLLSVAGIEAATAGNGREALQELSRTAYDVVLLDVKMPEMGGLETLAKIKEIDGEVEVIMLTGHASVDVAVEIMKLGGYEYLLKPCPVEDLTAKIEAAHERKLARQGKRSSSESADV